MNGEPAGKAVRQDASALLNLAPRARERCLGRLGLCCPDCPDPWIAATSQSRSALSRVATTASDFPRWSADGTSRRIAAVHKLGSCRRYRGHAARARSVDPTRMTPRRGMPVTNNTRRQAVKSIAQLTKEITMIALTTLIGRPALAATFVYVSNADDGDIGSTPCRRMTL